MRRDGDSEQRRVMEGMRSSIERDPATLTRRVMRDLDDAIIEARSMKKSRRRHSEAGRQVFCAGANIKMLVRTQQFRFFFATGTNVREWRTRRSDYRAINGHAVGGGSRSRGCDMRIARKGGMLVDVNHLVSARHGGRSGSRE